jgi:hypothetical protein
MMRIAVKRRSSDPAQVPARDGWGSFRVQAASWLTQRASSTSGGAPWPRYSAGMVVDRSGACAAPDAAEPDWSLAAVIDVLPDEIIEHSSTPYHFRLVEPAGRPDPGTPGTEPVAGRSEKKLSPMY